jgi:hypothetical protein
MAVEYTDSSGRLWRLSLVNLVTETNTLYYVYRLVKEKHYV